MKVLLHSHAVQRLSERGATSDEVIRTVLDGETFPARFGRIGFRRQFAYGSTWRGREYATKQLEVIAVREGEDWLVLTVVAKYF
jgi:Domain of unknown function (DUF4258)